MLRVLIGLGLPYAGVLGLLPWIASADVYVLGVPLVYAWMFLWFVLTSACLFVCWHGFDKHAADATQDDL
ncbi:DUF3311 domain-containing protein [Paraburkholderia pallida]|uniref:DUF3311 domain-containing protein n=1 Tax=Paraburkholderia pallida TaxID=2547399 RepID=A0A4P7CUW7_9BURK|nr:DUF3311 domain-containing protein [Paraburkholderia pallida]QBQ99925.1 DUF3311 domain-containing protein [Paraburkholderia pallida]